MSTFVAVTVGTLFLDLPILCAALVELGHIVHMQVKEVKDAKGCREQVDFVVQVGKAKGIDIGFKKIEDGSYQFIADWEALEKRGVSQKAFVEEVSQKYSYLKAMDEAGKQGYRLVEEKNETDGSIKVILRRY